MSRTAGSKGEKTAKAISEAAINLFAERGYAAVSMRAIAEKVGIQVGALYNYFATKQDVLLTVMIDHMVELLKAWDKVQVTSMEPRAAIEAFARFHVRYHMDRHDEVFISFMELRSLEPGNFKKAETLRQRYEYEVRDILERGRAAGIFKVDDCYVCAVALITMLTGVTTWFNPNGRLSADQVEEIYASMALQAVGLTEGNLLEMKEAM